MSPLSPRALLARWLARRARRRSMSFLLHRADDRLIEDIGLTRAKLHALLETEEEVAEDESPRRGARSSRPHARWPHALPGPDLRPAA